jgi:undecaprenyl-diphosphatase
MNSLIIFSAKYLYLFVIGIYAVYFFKISKGKRKDLALLTIIALPLIYIVSRIPAMFYFDPRPFVAGHFAPLIPHAPDNGFPSDHALLTSAIASIVYFHNKKVSALLWLLTFIVGASRVLAGVHHWVDIFGACVISLAVTTLTERLLIKSKIISYKTSYSIPK